jgi:hypothetical protein
MVGEFPELQGIMGGYYARHDGLSEDMAFAIEDHYKPRFAGDELPRNPVGVVVALADKLETLVGMFGIGNLPTGDKDPFALRRHALGVIRMLIERPAAGPGAAAGAAVPAFGDSIADASALTEFIYDRLAGSLREQGYSAQEVDAVLALRPTRLGLVGRSVWWPCGRLPRCRKVAALAAANKRIGNIGGLGGAALGAGLPGVCRRRHGGAGLAPGRHHHRLAAGAVAFYARSRRLGAFGGVDMALGAVAHGAAAERLLAAALVRRLRDASGALPRSPFAGAPGSGVGGGAGSCAAPALDSLARRRGTGGSARAAGGPPSPAGRSGCRRGSCGG